MDALTFGIVSTEPTRVDSIRAMVAGTPMRLVFEWAATDRPESAMSDLARVRPDMVVLDAPLPRVPEIIRGLGAASTSTDVIVVLQDDCPESILHALRAGAQEFATPPHRESLPQAMERIAARRSIITEPRRGKIVGFLSAKGGCGSTTIAVHVARDMSEGRALLIDLDLDAGLIAFLLRIQGGPSIADAARLERLDGEAWASLTSSFHEIRYVLPAPPAGQIPDAPAPAKLKAVLRSARRQYDWTIADLGRGISSLNFQLLPDMDQLYLVATPDVAALYKARETVRWWTGQGLHRDRLKLIVNRMPARPDIGENEIEKALGIPVAATLPDASLELTRVYQAGTLLPRNSAFARKLESFAKDLLGVIPVIR